jgi:hypothetical protein
MLGEWGQKGKAKLQALPAVERAQRPGMQLSSPPPSVLEFELRAITSSHSASPFLGRVFSRCGLTNYLPGLASWNHDPSYLCLLSS